MMLLVANNCVFIIVVVYLIIYLIQFTVWRRNTFSLSLLTANSSLTCGLDHV
jgi:uncharacterized membrane protein YesL